MFKKLRILLIVPCLLFFAANAVAETLPMVSFSRSGPPPVAAGVYTGDSLAETIDTVNNTMSYMAMPDINPAQTKMVFVDTVGANNYGTIKVYDLAGKSTASIATVTALKQSEGGNVANFTADGKILFVDSADYKLKKINTDGDSLSLEVVALPPEDHQYTYFALSPDRTKVAIITRLNPSTQWAEGCTRETCNNEVLYVVNTDGSGSPRRLTEFGGYLGEWNFISWKQDSQALLYYHHHFSGGAKLPASYTLFNVSGGTPALTEFSGGVWDTEGNVCLFTKTGNLLSLVNQKLYNGETGTLIADVSSTVPNMMTGGIVGWSTTGEFYFADDTSGTSFRMFIEPGSLYADFGSTGIWQYSGSTWSQVTPYSPTDMVAAGNLLYGKYDNGIWQHNGSTWTQLTPYSPTAMAASSSLLYGKYDNGIWQYSGSTWTQLTPYSPTAMVAAGNLLYGKYDNGIWLYNGSTWSQVTPYGPSAMVAAGSLLYANYDNGIWLYNGSTWSQVTPYGPTAMVAAGSLLYANYDNGVWMYNGSTWSQVTPNNPEAMVATDSLLYADFGSTGIWMYNGSTWSQITPNNPTTMIVP